MDSSPCLNCPSKDNCDMHKILDNTLDSKKCHYKVSLQLDFILTAHNPEEFEEDFHYECATDIATNAAALAESITDLIKDIGADVMPMGAQMNVGRIPNKVAFQEMTDYIKVTHEQEDNR